MNDALAQSRFGGAPVAVLATITEAGGPRLVPVTFALDDDRVFIAIDHKPKTTRRLARLSDIRRDPRVSLLTQHYDEDWTQLWWVRATGTAAIRDDEHAVDAAGKLLGVKYPQYQERTPVGPIINVVVEAWRWWEAAAT